MLHILRRRATGYNIERDVSLPLPIAFIQLNDSHYTRISWLFRSDEHNQHLRRLKTVTELVVAIERFEFCKDSACTDDIPVRSLNGVAAWSVCDRCLDPSNINPS